MATPLHIIPVNNGFPRACIACARQYKHLRLLCKNTPRYSLYTDLMKILEIDISKLENIRCKLYICDRCICLTQRVNSLREPCQTHVNNLMKIEQSRRKRIQMHSASPNVRIENGSYGRIETGTPRSESEKANISLKFLQKMPNANYMVGPRQSENQEAHSKVLTGKINLSDHVRDTITDQREINRAEERNETDRPRNETKKSNILLKFSPKVPTTDQIIDTKSCQSGNQVADSTVSTGEIKLEDHMYAVTCCTDQPELSPGEKDTNRPRYDTEQSNFLQNFPKIVSNTELMVGTHQSEILKAHSKVSTWENKLLDHVYDASTDQLATNGGGERKETDRPRNETKKAIILLQFPKKGPSTNQIIDTKYCQSENQVADSKASTGEIKIVDHVYAASCSTDQSELSPSEKRKDTDEHRNETKQSEVSLNFPKRVPDTEQTVGTHQSENKKADSKVSTGEIKVLDHEYAADSCRDTADIYKDHSILKSFITESIPSNEIETLSKLSTTKSDLDSRKVSSKIMQLPHVSTAIRNLFLNEITFKMDRICGVRQKSVLVSPVCELNDKIYFNKIINEMEKRCPFILDILIAMCSPAHFNLKDTNYTVAAMYSMAMHSRNPKLKTAFKRKRAASSKRRHGGNNTLDPDASFEATPLEESINTVGKRHLCDCGYATVNKSNFNKHKKRCSQSTLSVSKMSSVPAKKRKTKDQTSDRLVWVDLEMTGLTADTDHILEMACLITDSQLNVVAESADLVIHQPDTVLDSMGEWCKKHHGQSGLTEAVKRSEISLDDARKTMVSFVREYTAKGSCPLAGNTVHADKTFLVKYMPDFMEHLHYRIVDVSTIKELCRRWYPEKFNKAPKKAETHRALDDIKESIEELKYYRKTIFIEKDSS